MTAILDNPMALHTPEHFTEPSMALKAGTRQFGVVSVPELAEIVLKDTTRFGRSVFMRRLLTPALGEGLLTADGAAWRRQRRAASPAFRAKALNGLVPTFNNAGERLAARLLAQARATGAAIDVAPHMVQATFEVIAETLLHDDEGEKMDADAISEDISVFVESVARFTAKELLPLITAPLPRRLFIPNYKQGQAAIGRLRSRAEDIVKRRSMRDQSDATDLMGLLIAARDPETGDALTPAELVDNALTFIAAGHETTAVALSWTLYCLAHSPQWQERLREEAATVLGEGPVTADTLNQLSLHEQVVKEAMRLFPPAPIVPRSVKAPVSLGDHRFKQDDHVSISIYAMHRHQTLWDEPDAFDPTRFTPEAEETRSRFQFLPFGGGGRICIGQKFAIMEAVSILAQINRRVRVSLNDGHAPEPYLRITLRPRNGMPLTVQPV